MVVVVGLTVVVVVGITLVVVVVGITLVVVVVGITLVVVVVGITLVVVVVGCTVVVVVGGRPTADSIFPPQLPELTVVALKSPVPLNTSRVNRMLGVSNPAPKVISSSINREGLVFDEVSTSVRLSSAKQGFKLSRVSRLPFQTGMNSIALKFEVK